MRREGVEVQTEDPYGQIDWTPSYNSLRDGSTGEVGYYRTLQSSSLVKKGLHRAEE